MWMALYEFCQVFYQNLNQNQIYFVPCHGLGTVVVNVVTDSKIDNQMVSMVKVIKICSIPLYTTSILLIWQLYLHLIFSYCHH